MARDVKQRAILYLGLAALLTILIAASLARAQFRPGLPMPVTDGQSFAVALPEFPVIKFQVNTFFFVLFSIFLATLVLVTLFRLMRGTSWKRLALDFLLYTLVALVGFGAFALVIAALPRSAGVAQLPTQLPARVAAPLGALPPLWLWLAGFILLVGAVALGGGFVVAQAPYTAKAEPDRSRSAESQAGSPGWAGIEGRHIELLPADVPGAAAGKGGRKAGFHDHRRLRALAVGKRLSIRPDPPADRII